jgi:hypothetical protein
MKTEDELDAEIAKMFDEVKEVRVETVDRGVREGMVERGGIAQSPDGRLWRVLSVDDEKVVLAKLRGWKRIELTWTE